jgi:LPXTG-motif cell wall-anchored protein
MSIFTKAAALGALLVALLLPAAAASAQECTGDYCNPDVPSVGGNDAGDGDDSDDGDVGAGGDENDEGGETGGAAGGSESGGAGGAEVDDDGEVLGVGEERSGGGPAGAEGEVLAGAASAPSGSLPLTGADVVQLVAIGVAAIGVGSVLVRRSRRTAKVTA